MAQQILLQITLELNKFSIDQYIIIFDLKVIGTNRIQLSNTICPSRTDSTSYDTNKSCSLLTN